MNAEVIIIEFLQQAEFLKWPMFILTFLGDELFFVTAVSVLYWCYDKRFAYRLANVYFLSVGCTELLKNTISRPRPYVSHESVRGAFGKTGGFSFPSGHSQSIANLSTQSFLESRRKKAHIQKVLYIGISATLVVMLSRMFLGQHYLTDVLAGAALGVGLAVLFTYIYRFLGEKEEWLFVVIAPLCFIVYMVCEATGIAPTLTDVIKTLGAYAAFTAGYFLEKRYVCYQVKSDKKYKQILKIVFGLGVTLVLKELLKLGLPDVAFFHFLRYFLIAFWASLIAPLLFKKLKL